MRRLSTRAAGLLILILGLWGGLVPFVGPYFHFTLGPTKSWTWTTGRLWLDVVPGVIAVIGGLMLLSEGPRPAGKLGALLALAAGIWFAIGPSMSLLWNSAGAEGAGHGGKFVRVLEMLGYHTLLGTIIAALAGYALPGLVTRRAEAEAEAEAGGGRRSRRRRCPDDGIRRRCRWGPIAGAGRVRAAASSRAGEWRDGRSGRPARGANRGHGSSGAGSAARVRGGRCGAVVIRGQRRTANQRRIECADHRAPPSRRAALAAPPVARPHATTSRGQRPARRSAESGTSGGLIPGESSNQTELRVEHTRPEHQCAPATAPIRTEPHPDRTSPGRLPADARAIHLIRAAAERLHRTGLPAPADRYQHRQPHARRRWPSSSSPPPQWRREFEHPAVIRRDVAGGPGHDLLGLDRRDESGRHTVQWRTEHLRIAGVRRAPELSRRQSRMSS